MTDINVTGRGLRGESLADILRRTGQFSVAPTDTDAQALEKYNNGVAADQVALAEEWAENPENDEVTGNPGQYSAKHHSAKASAQRALAAEWSSNPEDGEITGSPGSYSALHYSAKAAEQRGLAEDAATEASGYLATTAASAATAASEAAKAVVVKDEIARKALWQAKRQALLHRVAPTTLVLTRNIWVLGDSVSGGVGSPVEFKNLLDARIAVNCNFTGYSSGTTLTVTAINGGATGTILRDQIVDGNANARIVQQLSGTAGGVGTYELSSAYNKGSVGSPQAFTSRYYAFREGTAGTKTSEHLATMTAAPAWKKRADTIETSGSINDYNAAPIDRDWAWSGSTKANMDAMQALLTDGATFFIFHVWADNAAHGWADVEYHVRAMRAAYGARFVDIRAEMVADVKFAGLTGPDDFGRRRLYMPVSTFAGYGLTNRPRNFAAIRSYNTGSPVAADYTDGQILDNQFNNQWAVKTGALGGGTIAGLDTKHPGEWGHRLMDFIGCDLINALNNLAAPFIPSGHKTLIAKDIAAQAVAITLPSVGSLSRLVRADIVAGDEDGLFAIDRETLQIRRSNYGTLDEGFRILVVELEDTSGNTRQCDAHIYTGMASTDTAPRLMYASRPIHASGMTGNDVPNGSALSTVIRARLAAPATNVYLLNADNGGAGSRAYVRIATDGRLSILCYDDSGTLIANLSSQNEAFAAVQGIPFVRVPWDADFTLFVNFDWSAGVLTAFLNTAANGDQQFRWGTNPASLTGTISSGKTFGGAGINWKYGYLVQPGRTETAIDGMSAGGGFCFVGVKVGASTGIDWTISANRRLFANTNGTPAFAAKARPEVSGQAWDLVPFDGRGKWDNLYGWQPGDELTSIGFEPWLISEL